MQLKLRRDPTPPSPSRQLLPLLALVLVMIYYAQRGGRSGDASNIGVKVPRTAIRMSSSVSKGELLSIYDLPPSYPKEPAHLTPIDPSTLIPKGTYPIDVAHRNGYLHVGHVLYIMDSAGKILFLQRSSDVVTCPGTWSILGEHANAGEDAVESVVRGIEEELGFVALNFEESHFKGAWGADLHPKRNMKETLQVTIQNVTEFPLYYIRHYGPRNENRIDRQLTYLWLVQFPRRHEEIKWQLDDEVAAHKWIGLDEVGEWLSENAGRDRSIFKSEGGVADDGPDSGDFCHRTIRSLYEAGLMRIL